MKYTLLLLTTFLISFLYSCTTSVKQENDKSIKPYEKNLKYWQYKGEPILLIGGSKTDHLFLADSLVEHLDEMVKIGANYVRNTMSQGEGLDLKPHKRLENGQFDLNQWNEAYWQKFADFLLWTYERNIIVQIEIWDRFNYAVKYWQHSPWHPKNNVNYSAQETGLANEYPERMIYDDLLPFFHTIPGMPEYRTSLDLIRKYQENFIDKMLSYSLKYGHVLYCVNNETTTSFEWGKYWINYINDKANKKNARVFCTDMFDKFFQPNKCPGCLHALEEADIYSFLDVSQNNSRNFNQSHWDTLQWIIKQRDKYPLRPLNNTKIYGGMNSTWGSGSNKDGIERFCRNVIGGCATARHHRPPYGNGLNEKAKASIQAVRKVEKDIKFWEINPGKNLLYSREEDEAYVSAKEGEKYVLYFPDIGDVRLNLNAYKNTFITKWINISTGEYGVESTLQGGSNVNISTPSGGSWFLLVLKQ